MFGASSEPASVMEFGFKNLKFVELLESGSELQRRVNGQRGHGNERQRDHDDQLEVVTATGQRVNVATAHCTVHNVLG